MKTHRDLTIDGDTAGLDGFSDDITNHLKDGWERDHEQEKPDGINEGLPLVFSYTTSAERHAARVWLYRNDHSWRLTNIVPIKGRELTQEQYNVILEEFTDRYVKPSAVRLKLSVSMGSATVNIHDSLSADAYEAFKDYLVRANKSSAYANGSDLDRWQTFIAKAHIGQCKLDPQILGRWLKEQENFPDATAFDLVSLYEGGRKLLQCYDLLINDQSEQPEE